MHLPLQVPFGNAITGAIQASSTKATGFINGGSPSNSQGLGSCSLKLTGETPLRPVKSRQAVGEHSSSHKGRAGGRSILILSSALRGKPREQESSVRMEATFASYCQLFLHLEKTPVLFLYVILR